MVGVMNGRSRQRIGHRSNTCKNNLPDMGIWIVYHDLNRDQGTPIRRESMWFSNPLSECRSLYRSMFDTEIGSYNARHSPVPHYLNFTWLTDVVTRGEEDILSLCSFDMSEGAKSTLFNIGQPHDPFRIYTQKLREQHDGDQEFAQALYYKSLCDLAKWTDLTYGGKVAPYHDYEGKKVNVSSSQIGGYDVDVDPEMVVSVDTGMVALVDIILWDNDDNPTVFNAGDHIVMDIQVRGRRARTETAKYWRWADV